MVAVGGDQEALSEKGSVMVANLGDLAKAGRIAP
jgi:hypothetical protein